MVPGSRWLAFALLVLPLVVEANVFVTDDRVVMERQKGSPYTVIGYLQKEKPQAVCDASARRAGRPLGQKCYQFGTAFLVGPRHILTAYHVAFYHQKDPSSSRTSEFFVGQGRGGAGFERRAKATPVAWGRRHERGMGTRVDQDWALLELDQPLGNEFGWAGLATVSLEEAMAIGSGLALAGYPKDRVGPSLVLEPTCAIRGFIQDWFAWGHDCATRERNSGSPIFYKDPSSGGLVVVAIHTGGVNPSAGILREGWDEKTTNMAVPATAFIEQIKPHLGQ